MEAEKVTAAVRALRTALGETQQSLAGRMGIAISSMARYETTRAPKGAALAGFAQLAHASGLVDLEKTFQDALSQDLGYGMPLLNLEHTIDISPGEERLVHAFLAVIRQPARYWKQLERLERILRPIMQTKQFDHFAFAQAFVEQGEKTDEILEAPPDPHDLGLQQTPTYRIRVKRDINEEKE